MMIKRLAYKLIDSIFDCSFVEKTAYFIEDGAFWRETVFSCRRCAKKDTLSQVMIDSEEFWETASPYCLSLEQRES